MLHSNHTGQGLDTCDQLALERLRLFRAIALRGQIKLGLGNPFHLKTGVRGLRQIQAAHQQSGGNQQHHAHRHLHPDERVAQYSSARSLSDEPPAIPFQRGAQVLPRCVERRRQSKHDSCKCRQPERISPNAQVRTHVPHQLRGAVRQVRHDKPGDTLDRPEGHKRPHGSAKKGEQQALREQLPDDSPTASPDRKPNRNLFLPRRRPRQEKIRHIGAGDQQDQSDPRQHHGPNPQDHRAFILPSQESRAVNRQRGCPPGILLINPRRDHSQIRAHLFECRAGPQASEQRQPAGVVFRD